MLEEKWFGIRSDAMFLSTISPFERALTEHEFTKFSLTYQEKSDHEKGVIGSEYSLFFEKYISKSCELIWDTNGFKKLPIIDVQQHCKNFVTEKNIKTYIDFSNNIIFDTDWYLEMHVYSKKPFFLGLDISLHQRTTNTIVSWEETNWF